MREDLAKEKKAEPVPFFTPTKEFLKQVRSFRVTGRLRVGRHWQLLTGRMCANVTDLRWHWLWHDHWHLRLCDDPPGPLPASLRRYWQEEADAAANPDHNRVIRVGAETRKTGVVKDKHGNIIGAQRTGTVWQVSFCQSELESSGFRAVTVLVLSVAPSR
jgi:hypothetical protein